MTYGLRRLLAPEFLGRLKSVFHLGNYYTGNYSDWASANADATGYDSEAILERVRSAARKVRDGEVACERDSVLFEEPQYSFPVLAALFRAAERCEGRLAVLDFGGSLGSSYFQCRGFLDVLNGLSWSVVEQEGFVRCGREEFQSGPLRFDFTIAESCAAINPNVALLSGVLQYVPDPYAVLREISEAGIPHVIIDRLSTSSALIDHIAVQHVPSKVYSATYPIRIFGAASVESALARNYRVVARFDTTWDDSHPEYCAGLEFRSCGLILEKNY